eukprot:752267-Hanusia_phi.AAC.4
MPELLPLPSFLVACDLTRCWCHGGQSPRSSGCRAASDTVMPARGATSSRRGGGMADECAGVSQAQGQMPP